MNFNVYDAGEWLWYKHPRVKVEVHLLTRMATGHIAATAGFAIKKGKDTIIVESPHCANGRSGQNIKVYVKEGQYCKTIGADSSYTTKNSKIKYSHRGITIDGFHAKVGGVWWYRWHGNYCNRHGWLNAFLKIKGPKDGRSRGLCGPFNGNRGTDYRVMRSGHGHRGHGQWSTSYRESVRVPKSRSFFRCGVYGMPRFKQLVNNARANSAMVHRRMESHADAVASDAAALEMNTDLNALGGDINGDLSDDAPDALNKKRALEKCKKRKDISTADALADCAEDLARTGDNKVEEVAEQSSTEEIEEAMETMEENEKDEKLELVAEAKMKKPKATDAVLQWCSNECDDDDNWKQLKAYPMQIYNGFLTDGKWQRMTARIPEKALSKNLQIRFYQKTKKCYCCNPFAISNLIVLKGGWPVAVAADSHFKLFADGEFVGRGDWWETAKDTYRFRVPPTTKTFAVEIKGGENARMGLIGSFGPSVVSSGTWKCKSNLSTPYEIDQWKNSSFDDSKWPYAVEEGDNGVLPWGPRSSIAKDAKWIFTHESYKMSSKRAYCRVSVRDAWLSHSKKHLDASRWSCKAHGKHRQSPFVISLNAANTLGVEVKSGKEEDDYQTPGASFSTIQQTFTNETTGNTTISEQRILMKVLMKKIMEKTMEGGLIKRAILRLKVLDTWTDAVNATAKLQHLHVCKIIRKWNVKEVTFSTVPAFDGPITNCKVVTPAAKSQWADLDITQWLREWVTNPKENFGMMFFPPPNDEDQASFVSFLDPDANERPRLSLSCHGDKSDAYESVFIERTKKEQKSSLVENIDNMTQQDFKQPI
jgi:hypothetical protein